MCKRIQSAFISVQEGSPSTELHFHPGINILCGRFFADDPLQLMKDFHGQPILKVRNNVYLLDGRQLPVGVSGATDLLLKKLGDILAEEDDRPLFVCNFLERLDEAVDLQPVFEALNATGRQIFIAVPHYYNIKTLEEKPYVTDIHIVSSS